MSDAMVKGLAGAYTVGWEQEQITIRIDRIREDSRYAVRGEAKVTYMGNHVHQARYDLTATQSRKTLSVQCGERHPGPDWTSFIEEASLLVLERFRTGEPVIDFGEFEPGEQSQFLVYPLLLKGEPNLLFGPGGSGKSYIAAYMASLVSYANDGSEKVQGMEVNPGRVLYLDYETSPEEIFGRMQSIRNGMGLDQPLNMMYQFLTAPIDVEIEKIQRTVVEEEIDLVVVDSVGYACGGEPEVPQRALDYYRALRTLKCTSLSVGHIAKDIKATTPFGTVYWVNGARSVWEVVKTQEAEQSRFHVVLIHQKINNSTLKAPLSFELQFGEGELAFTRQEISMVPDADAKLPLSDRIMAAIQLQGPRTVNELVEALEAKANSISRSLMRSPRFLLMMEGPHQNRWAIRPDGEEPPAIVAATNNVVLPPAPKPAGASSFNMDAWEEGQADVLTI